MIIIEIVIFLLMVIIFGLDHKISSVHLTKLQNTAHNSYSRSLKNLAYRRTQSLFVFRSILFILGFSWLYLVSNQLGYPLALFVVLVSTLTMILLVHKISVLDPILMRLMNPIDVVIRRYGNKLSKLSGFFVGGESDQKVYKPYDDKEFKKLITSLHSSDNLVNKKVLSKIENLFKLEYKTVEDIMIPMAKVTVVDEDDYVGPIMLDELHKTTQHIFPVGSEGRIVGSVNLSDMKDHTGKIKVKDLTKHDVNFVQEDASLEALVEVLIEYKNEQFLVIDGKENIRGVVNIYQVLQLFFDQSG